MPTILSHPAAPLALRRVFGALPLRVVIAGVIGSIAPDLDVIGFAAGVPYGSMIGHRGVTHSIAFALLFAAIAMWIAPRGARGRAFAFLFLATLSHPLFDALTDGGRGVAFFAPFTNRRFFFPWRPIRVSPIGRLDARVLVSELLWVWLPCGIAALLASAKHRGKRDRETGEERR
jgi:inner membrane protein